MVAEIETGPGWELRLGRWQDVLANPRPSTGMPCLISDPPYSSRTETGQRSDRGNGPVAGVTCGSLDLLEAARLVDWATSLPLRWLAIFGDDITNHVLRKRLNSLDAFRTFPPVPWCKTTFAPRFMADGPTAQTEYLAIARPRRRLERQEKRFRQGYYLGPQCRGGAIVGQKPLWLMRALVKDYSEPGDLIVDPYAGTGTTLLAAILEGRRAIGAEMDPDTFRLAVRRLRGEAAIQTPEREIIQTSFLSELEEKDP